jgi:hypothetical protein
MSLLHPVPPFRTTKRFWHPWACAGNVTGCPWLGHGNASRIFDSYLVTVGHGTPSKSRRIPALYALALMHDRSELTISFAYLTTCRLVFC